MQRALFDEGYIYVGVPPLYKVCICIGINLRDFEEYYTVKSIVFAKMTRLRGESKQNIAMMMLNLKCSRVPSLQMHLTTFRGLKVSMNIMKLRFIWFPAYW